MNEHMTFHESYGPLPKNTLRLIKRNNVSPADFDMMLDEFMFQVADLGSSSCRATWAEVDAHIVSNSETGMYNPRYF